MIRMNSDYTQGAHPAILSRLAETNDTQFPGYGEDALCQSAIARIRALCAAPEADVHFLVGGTQVNAVTLAAALRPYQAVLAAETGHIAVHETGAVEATGHKVVTLPGVRGKLTAEAVERAVSAHFADGTHEHITQPGAVYLSQTTECGTVYTLGELAAISAVCRRYGLFLYVDGARMACALAVQGAPTLEELALLCDAFTLGGTKCGALFGEALVLTNKAVAKDFRYMMKQRGAMLAKGWLLGLPVRGAVGRGA